MNWRLWALAVEYELEKKNKKEMFFLEYDKRKEKKTSNLDQKKEKKTWPTNDSKVEKPTRRLNSARTGPISVLKCTNADKQFQKKHEYIYN